MLPVKKGLSQAEARKALRHEHRIELALEGLFWDDIKRWNAGSEFYPCKVIGGQGELIQVRYDLEKNNLLPIPDSEISLSPKLIQNPKY